MGKSGSVERNMSSGINAPSRLPISLEDLPVTRIQDILMYSLGDSEDCAFDDILGQLCSNAFKHTPISPHSDLEENKSPVTTANPVMDETPKNHKRAKGEQKQKGVDEISKAIDTTMEGCVSPSRGVVTRSMSRLKNLNKLPQENVPSNSTKLCKNFKHMLAKKPSSNSSIKSKNSKSEATKKQFGGMVTRSAMKGNPATISSEEVMEVPDRSLIRRSRGRLKS